MNFVEFSKPKTMLRYWLQIGRFQCLLVNQTNVKILVSNQWMSTFVATPKRMLRYWFQIIGFQRSRHLR